MKDMRLKLTLTGDGRQLSGVLKDAQDETRQFGAEAQSAGGRADTAFGKTRAGVESISTQLESARQQVLAFVGVSQLIGKAADLTRTTAAWQDAETRLTALAGSAALYAEHEEYLIDLAGRHHKNLLTLSDSYSRLLTLENAGLMTNEQNRQILEGLSNATSRLGADNAQLEQAMYGLAQGFSAGILRAEEFNQVTEPLPGLMQELDKAAGLGAGGFRKLVNAGEVTSAMFRDTLIEALKAYDGAAADTANNINAKLTDVENSYINLARVLEQPITNALSPVLDGISGSMALVADHADLLATGIQVGMVVAAGRGVSALTSLTTATLSDLAAKRAAAVQELELAKAQAASTAAALRNAQAQVGLTAAHGNAARAAAAHQAALVRLTAAKTAVRGAGSLLLGVFGGPVGLIATVGLAAASFIDFGSGANSSAKETKALEQQTKLLTTRVDELTAAQARQRLQQLEEPYKQAQIDARMYAAQVETLTKRLSEFPGSAKAEEWRRSLIDAQGNLDTANSTLAEYTDLQGRLQTQIERVNAAQNEQTGQVTASNQAYISLKSTLDDVTRFNQQYYELVQKITSADITSAEKQELLSAAAKKRSADLEQLNKKQQTAIKLTDQQVDKYAELVEQLKFERDQLQRTELQRMIEINLRQVGAEVTAAQHDEIVRLTTALYNEKQATQAVQDELKLVSNQTNVWADITENAVNSVDNSFRELFRSGLDGWDDFWDQMLDTAKDMLAELAYTLVKQQLWVNVGMNVTGQGGVTGTASSAGSLVSNAGSLLQNGTSLLRNGLDFFNPSSGYTTSMVNNAAYSLGYGSNPALASNHVAAINGDFTGTLINPNGYVAQGLNAVGPAFAAYGFGQKYGVAGGVVGGVGSAALAGGVSGAIAGTGFMSGAATALTSLGPVGWGLIGVGALLGGLGGGEPSNKQGTATADLISGEVTIGGQTGDKFSQENRDAAESLTGYIAGTLLPQLSALSGVDLTSAGSVYTGVGNRDALAFKYSNADGQTYGFGRYARDNMADYIITPDGTVVPKSEATPGRGGNATALLTRDPREALNTVVKFFAKQNDAWQGIYDVLGGGDELTIDTMRRVQGQAALYSGAEDFYSALLPTVSGMFTQNAVDWKAQLAGTEPEQPAYVNPGYSFLPASTAVDWSAGIEEALGQALTQTAGLEGRSQEFADIFVASLAADLENAAIAADYDFSGDLATRLDQILADAIGSLESGDGLTAQIMGEFIGRDIYAAFAQDSETQLETVGRVVGAFNIVSGVFDNLGLEIDAIGIEALSASNRLVELSGGLDALTAGANYYYQNYFTEQERAQDQVDSYTALLSQFNAEFDTALSGRDDLRAFVESLDLTSDAGQRAYAAAMQLAPALQGLEAALSSVNEQVGRLDTYVEEQALAMQSALADGMDAALAALDTSVAAERTRLTEQYSAITDGIVAGMNTASAAVSRLQGLSDSLHSTIDRMRPIAFASQDYQSAQAQLREILQETRAGAALPESGQLTGMLATLARGDADQFGSRSAYLLDYARTARRMDELAGIADQRQSVQERAIATAELQLDLLERQHTDDLARLDNIVATAQEQVAIANGTYQATLSLTDGVFSVYQAIAEYRAFTGQNSDEQNAAFMDLVAEQLGEAATIQLAGYEGTATRLDALLTVTELAGTATPEALDLLQSSVDAGYQALLASLAESHADDQTASAELLALLGGGVDAQLANGERLTDVLGALDGVADAAARTGQIAVSEAITAAADSTRSLLDTLTTGQALSTQQTDQLAGQLVALGTQTDGVTAAIQSTGTVADIARARLLNTLTAGQSAAESQLSAQASLTEQLQAVLSGELAAQHLTLVGQSEVLISQTELASQSVTWLEQIHTALTAESESPDRLDALYQLMLGREADAPGKSYWSARLLDAGGDIGSLMDEFRSAAIAHGEIPAFASGGHYKGGVALVGERGPELINFDAPGQVYTANQTNDIFSAMARELAQLRAELAELRKEQRAGHAAIAANTGKTNRMLDRAMPEGDAIATRTVA